MPAAGPGRGRVRRLSSPVEAEEGILHHALGGRLVAQHEYREPDEAKRVRLVQRRHPLPGRVRGGAAQLRQSFHLSKMHRRPEGCL
jgi:hypothetical protein